MKRFGLRFMGINRVGRFGCGPLGLHLARLGQAGWRLIGSRVIILALFGVLWAACDSAPARDGSMSAEGPRAARTAAPKTMQATPRAAGGAAPRVAVKPESYERSSFSGNGRVVAIGDLHGDLSATRAVLRLAGAIDDEDRWVGGDLVLVQTGDQLDRGDDEKAIVDLLTRLRKEAMAAGGRLLVLSGNHETMNVRGDFRYVTPAGFTDFDAVEVPDVQSSDPSPSQSSRLAMQLPRRARARAAAFLPGGHYAKRLAAQPVVAIVDDTVFAHGGVLRRHVNYGIDRLNTEVAAWFRGESGPPKALASQDSPVWTRLYSEATPTSSACDELRRVLKSLNATRMVVGHTVQKNGITSACDDRVWRIDVGMSSYYRGSSVEALEVTGAKVKVLRAPKSAPSVVP